MEIFIGGGEMNCTISMDTQEVKKLLGDISQEDFETFCKDAVALKLFTSQFVHCDKQDREE